MGPMVMAGFMVKTPKALEELNHLGLKDSKLLSPKRREHFYQQLRELGESKFEILMPFKLNELMNSRTLNVIEFEAAVSILEKLHKTRTRSSGSPKSPPSSLGPIYHVYIDAFGPAEKLGTRLQKALSFKTKMFSEHKADLNYPIVSAASILAKVTRDRIIDRLRKEVGDFGSGYPADPRTIGFLRNWLAKEDSVPPYVRTHWKTYSRLVQERNNTTLEEFS